jgi:hypothetical protein
MRRVTFVVFAFGTLRSAFYDFRLGVDTTNRLFGRLLLFIRGRLVFKRSLSEQLKLF